MDKPMKGRNTIRKGGFVTPGVGKTSRMIKRWLLDPKPGTTLARLEEAYLGALTAVDRVEAHTLNSKADKRFTPSGVKDEILKFVLSELVPDLHKSRTAIKKAKAEIAERRSKLKIDGPDPSDYAATARRREIRDVLAEMPAAKQAEYFAGYGDGLPAEVAMAILEMPAPEFSGVSKFHYDRLRQRALNAKHGPENAEIVELETGIELAESVVEMARDEVRLEVGGITQNEFDSLAGPIESKHSAPYLRKFKENGIDVVRVMKPGVVHSPQIATPQEIEAGIFYESYDAYMKERGSPAITEAAE